MKKLIAVLAAALCAGTVSAWQKSAPWTPDQDQQWDYEQSGNNIIITNGDWSFLCYPENGTGADGRYKLAGVSGQNGSGPINFDTINRDLEPKGKCVVCLGSSTGVNVFQNNPNITEVILSESIKIFSQPFNGCSNLGSVIFPERLDNLGNWGVFNGCNAITNMVNALPEGAPSIPTSMFNLSKNGNRLPAVRIPASVATIGDNAFKYAWLGGSGDTTVFDTLSANTNLVSIGANAFQGVGCSGDLYLTNSTPVTIGHDAFVDSGLTSLVLTAPGSRLEHYIFPGTQITNLNLSGVVHIGDQAFQSLSGGLTEKTILLSPAVTNIGSKAFYKVNHSYIDVREPLPGEEIPEVECRIGSEAFTDFSEYCSNRHSLVIPFKGHCTIESKAFHWTVKIDKFIFWGKAPTFAADAFNAVGSAYSYKSQIVAPKGLDDDNWEALATPLSDDELARDDIPANCFGTYTGNNGCVYWMCWGTSPYVQSTVYGVVDDGATTNRYLDITAAIGDARSLGKSMTIGLSGNQECDVSIPAGLDITFDFGSYSLKGDVVVSGFGSLTVKSGYIDGQISVEPYDPGKLYFTGDQNSWKFTEMEHLGRGMFFISGINPGHTWKFVPAEDFEHMEWLSHGNTTWNIDGDEYSQEMYKVNNIHGGDFVRPESTKFDIYADTLNNICYLVKWEDDDTPPARKAVPPLADPSISGGYFTGTVSNDWVADGCVKKSVSVVKDDVTYTTQVTRGSSAKPGLIIFLR